jgi:hypothetical protein
MVQVDLHKVGQKVEDVSNAPADLDHSMFLHFLDREKVRDS